MKDLSAKKNANKIIMKIFFILLLKHNKCYLLGNIIFKSIVFRYYN